MRRSQSLDLLIFDPEIERTARRLRKARRDEIRAMAENRDNENPPLARPIRDHFRPVLNAHYSGIARGTINANNFELKPALINMVQQNQFNGAATSDPHLHLRTFLEITDTVKMNNVSDDIIRLRLFPFSLRDQARGWLQSLPLGSITTWQELATKFLAKYFPPAKSAQLKIEISTFRQTEFEQLYEAWERYKELLRKCPNHGFEDWVQIELFYNGLNGQTRGTVDAAAGGTIFAKSPDEAYDLLEQMTINSYQWPSERSGARKTSGVYSVDPITSLTAQVSALTTQIAAMNKGSIAEVESASVVAEEPQLAEEAQYINNRNFGGYGGYRGNLPPNTYHPGLRNHENFSYANNKNVLNPPPGFNTSKGEGKPSFEDLVGAFVTESGKRMSRTEARLDSLELHMTNMGATMKSLETQMGQLTTAVNSRLPGTSFTNTADKNLKEVNAIFVHHDENEVVVNHEESSFSRKGRGKKIREEVLISDIDISKLPYPQRYLQLNVKSHNDKILENSKNLHTNIFAADIESASVVDESCKKAQREIPPKLEDPGKFTVPCVVEGQSVGHALCDLGASVNVLPSSLYKELGLTGMKQTELMLQLADKSVRKPCGLVEDVVVKIDTLRLHADFLVLDFDGDPMVPIILGRPFLATAGAVIDVGKGELTMKADSMTVKFKGIKKESMKKISSTYEPP